MEAKYLEASQSQTQGSIAISSALLLYTDSTCLGQQVNTCRNLKVLNQTTHLFIKVKTEYTISLGTSHPDKATGTDGAQKAGQGFDCQITSTSSMLTPYISLRALTIRIEPQVTAG